MAYYRATSAQWAYFRKLTGESLPQGCNKDKASRLIKQALAGTYQKKKDKVTAYAWRFTGLAAECLKEEHKGIKYAVDKNYRLEKNGFESLEAAEAWARAVFPDAEIEVSNSVREQYMD